MNQNQTRYKHLYQFINLKTAILEDYKPWIVRIRKAYVNNFQFSFFLSRQMRISIQTLGKTMLTRYNTIKMRMFYRK